MNLIGYVRVSTEEQAEHGHSVKQQMDELTRWAAEHGHQLCEGHADRGVSASVPLARRPGGIALAAGLRAGLDGVVVTRLDRLFRDALDGLDFFRDCRNVGAVVLSVHDQIDTSTAVGRLHLTIQLATAQYEREITAERVKAVSDSLREQGRVYGHAPFGTVDIDGRLYRCPKAWTLRDQILQWRADGWPLRSIAARLRKQRVPAPNGGDSWPASSIKRVIDTHEQLRHLPWLPTVSAAATSGD